MWTDCQNQLIDDAAIAGPISYYAGHEAAILTGDAADLQDRAGGGSHCASRMTRPPLNASESEIIAFARDWVRYAAKHGIDEALRLLDRRDSDPPWSDELVRFISKDHFGDGEDCVITDPNAFPELRVEAYRYNDGSGFAVDHDLAMNHQRSDFTAQFDFKKTQAGYAIYLDDIHVL
jgi:hypothetical protein